MSVRSLIPAVAALLLLGGCRIEPPLHLRQTVATEVVLNASVSTEFLWQMNWDTVWDFEWQADLYGPVGYTAPGGIRMHIYPLDDNGQPKAHNVYNFNGLSGKVDIFVGTHDLLFHNNDSEVLLFRSDDDLSPQIAYTRVISSRLRASSLVQTIAQKTKGSKAGPEDEIEEPVAYMPDQLFAMFDPRYPITDNLDDYEYINGQYVLRIKGELRPLTYIYLFQIRFLHNDGRVTGSMGAALSGVSESVNMFTGETSPEALCIPGDVRVNTKADPDLFGARMLTFGIPGCNPYDAESVASAPEGRHYFVLNVTFNNGRYKNLRIDVTEALRALPTGGVIPLELDVDDFPPEETDPPVSGGGGFDPVIGDWQEETGSTTIVN